MDSTAIPRTQSSWPMKVFSHLPARHRRMALSADPVLDIGEDFDSAEFFELTPCLMSGLVQHTTPRFLYVAKLEHRVSFHDANWSRIEHCRLLIDVDSLPLLNYTRLGSMIADRSQATLIYSEFETEESTCQYQPLLRHEGNSPHCSLMFIKSHHTLLS